MTMVKHNLGTFYEDLLGLKIWHSACSKLPYQKLLAVQNLAKHIETSPISDKQER